MKNITELSLVNYKFEGPPCLHVQWVHLAEAVTSRRHSVPFSPWALAGMCTLTGSWEKKGASISVNVVKASEKEFLFGTKKSFFLSMHWFHFQSEASWEILTVVFILFFAIIVFLFIIQTLQVFIQNISSLLDVHILGTLQLILNTLSTSWGHFSTDTLKVVQILHVILVFILIHDELFLHTYPTWVYIKLHTTGACEVMVTTIGNGQSKPSSNPGWGCLHFTYC